MMERTVLRSLLIAAFVMASSAACAAGRDEVIPNPNPDRTWGRTIGGVFTSGRSIAVVIGISNYIGERAGGYPALPTAKHDADKMADFLIKDAGFDTVYVLTDERATKSRIDVLMTDVIPGVVTPRDRFLFYWSGHGEQRFSADMRAFGFLPLASTKSKEFSAMVSMQDLERWDRYLDARQALFVLDACLSGLAGYQTKAPQNTRLEQLSLPSRHLLTAGTKDESVISGDRWGGSLFTDSFILGAKGQARSSSGIVSLLSLMEFIQERVGFERQAANWSKSLTPQLQSLQHSEGFFFFTPPQVAGLTSNAPRTGQLVERKGDIEQTTPQMNEAERAWNLAKDTKSVAVLESFIARYNDTFYAELARERIGQLKPNAGVAGVAPVSPARPPAAAPSVSALGTAPALPQQKTIKIGFVGSFSGPVAAIGDDMRNSFELGLDHLGRKLGGLPVEVIYEDDQIKPAVGVQKSQKLIESDKVDFIVGYTWSNVLLASLKPIVDSKTFAIVTNTGASQLAGELCSPYVFSTSWNNDQTPQAVGLYMNQKGVKTAFLIGPNYAAGKDMLEGVKATFKGQIVGQELTRWPDQLDFSAELSKARAAKPDAMFAFYPGGAGIQFITQYAQSGLKGQIPLYITIDDLSLPRLKDLAVGIPGAQGWVNDLPNEANKRYVADYKAKYKQSPSFYGAQTYDAVALIDSGLKAVNGDMTRKDDLRRALEKADFKSVRGNFKFGPNHIPIQNFYLQDAAKQGGDYVLKTVATIVENDQDKHVGKCPMK